MQQIVMPHYRLNIPKQQVVSGSSAPLTPLASSDEIKMPDNIFVQALSTNNAAIIISSASPAVAGGAGIELPPGGNVSLPDNDPSKWFVISITPGQKLNINYQAGIK
jgi:hypothetical protein